MLIGTKLTNKINQLPNLTKKYSMNSPALEISSYSNRYEAIGNMTAAHMVLIILNYYTHKLHKRNTRPTKKQINTV